jgi:hypothetical protein
MKFRFSTLKADYFSGEVKEEICSVEREENNFHLRRSLTS